MQFSEEYTRTNIIIGQNALEKLRNSKVAIFGVGGVGGYVCEALARVGVGELDLFDKDTVSITNINRQIIALHSTLGQPKVEVMKSRINDINPQIKVNTYEVFYLPENAGDYDLSKYDYIIDAVDTVSAKIELVQRATNNNVKIISAMGAGNKKHPELFEISDIYSTKVCPLARVMRRELKKRNIKSLKVVYSQEEPAKNNFSQTDSPKREDETIKPVPGSLSYVPGVMGLIIASAVVDDLINEI